MKRLFSFLLVAFTVFVSSGIVLGATSGKVTISVTLTTSASIWIGSSSCAFGSLAGDATSISATSIAVRNNSTALVTKWQLSAAVTTVSNPATLASWNGTANLSTDQIGLQALFNATQPAAGNFTSGGTTDTLDGTAKIFGDSNNYFSGDEAADNVTTGGINVNSEKHLWFRIKMPPALTNPSQTLDVSITASAI